jgi:hypothetical protein
MRLWALLMLPAAIAAQEGRLYKWQDEQGRVHYSDRPPRDDASSVEVRPLPRQGPAVERPEDDYYSVENQARRMEQQRKAREAARKEAEEKRRAEQRRKAELQATRDRAKQLEEVLEQEGYPVYVRPIPPVQLPEQPILSPERPGPSPGGSIPIPPPGSAIRLPAR